MLDRLKLAQRVDQIVVCTSTHPQDDRLADLAMSNSVAYFRGDEDDVLKRLYDAAVAYGVDYILNVTGDCPFSDPVYADKIVETFETTHADLIRAFDLPHGVYSYGIKPQALKTVLEIKDDTNTEVWGRYFSNTNLFDVYDLPIDNPLHRRPDLRMTLDYPEDLAFFEAVFAHLYQPGTIFSLDAILRCLQAHPEIVELNRHCEAAYEKRIVKQSVIKLKPRYTVRRVAILGCGAIGQRHIRNLRHLGITEILALRSRQGTAQELGPELGIREVQDWQELLDAQVDAVIISNPTSLHLEMATRLIPHVRGLFIEKPLAASLHGVQTLLQQVRAHKVVSFVGYNLNFHPVTLMIQELLESDQLGQPLLFQCQVGQWLPDWHPYEDYRKAYYARRELGGGVTLTLSHELHLALTLLGSAQAVSCLLSQSDLLSLDVDTISDMMIQHTSGAISQIHLDYIQRQLHRGGVISCEKGWIRYDLVLPKVVVQFEDEPTPCVAWEQIDYDMNQSYIDEMGTFLRYVSEGRMRHDLDVWRAACSLAVVDAAFASARSECLSKLPAWVSELEESA
jgi:predicted dehydrogenase/spore coat polysaccharide biosynthesis protein SpsF (cytidylyltransferase family)